MTQEDKDRLLVDRIETQITTLNESLAEAGREGLKVEIEHWEEATTSVDTLDGKRYHRIYTPQRIVMGNVWREIHRPVKP